MTTNAGALALNEGAGLRQETRSTLVKKARTHTLDAAGVTIRTGDTVGGTTSKLVTVVGELVQIGSSKVKVRLETDGIPVKQGSPVRGEELWITAERTFLVRRAVKTRQVLFSGVVDPELPGSERQETAWLLLRAANGCDCTDPDPAVCTAGCYPAGKGSQCRCHQIHTAEEVRSILTRARGLDPAVDDLEDLWRSLTESYVESGCGNNAERYAREFLAHHARALAVVMRMVRPYVAEDSGYLFGSGFAAGVDYLRAYAYGLDPEGNGAK